jgi:hypothetical protein
MTRRKLRRVAAGTRSRLARLPQNGEAGPRLRLSRIALEVQPAKQNQLASAGPTSWARPRASWW